MDKEILNFCRHAGDSGIILNDDQLGKFDLYRKELLKWNEKTNLISEKSTQEITGRHFLDSLTALPFIDKPNARIIDIGSGAGFPGIPLKIALPDLQLCLVETNRKKVSFLKHIVRLLNLKDTMVLHERVENLVIDDKWNSFFDILISRAAFKLPEMLPWGAILLAPSGKLIALKSRDIDQEFSEAAKAAGQYGFSQFLHHDINEKWSDITRKIIVGKKAG
jgi:16S rRNA (guanine527-N7)-methyltransferase